MKWSEICIHTTNEAIEPISNILHEIGASGVVIENPLDLIIDKQDVYGEIFELNPKDYPDEGVYIKAYLPLNSSIIETVEEIKLAVNNLTAYGIELGKNEVTWSEVDEEDWATAWKKYYKPIQVSEKITVTPTWENYQPTSEDEIVIELDPGMAFGTGTHPTTMLSIQALEKYVNMGDSVIDVGCGSGVLSIASARLGAKEVYAFDLDEVAVQSTKTNAEYNKVDDLIHLKQNNLLQDVHLQADIIVSNILAEIIIRFIDDAWVNLVDGGYFITSGIIQSKKEMVLNKMQEHGFKIIEINEIEDWVSIVAKKK
ncbi:50S ribosomal protein L11 methyltransferase [Ornithinibacillus halotolerans]|uniref:50S ribosomal protein L11 methyltransferase n=1 Tax=Ornithinibacillus halotolerans TaxID=1274357 RepID=UPI0016654DFC|nr:50S ribosomal protein L11 methyltransferase [Ornithinibacillus halotolerans]